MSWNKLEFLGIPRTLGIHFTRAILEQNVFLMPCNPGKREHWFLPIVLPKKQSCCPQ